MKKRKESRVRNEPYIYKIDVFDEGAWKRKCFRVQKKIKNKDGSRKTISEVFLTLVEARKFRDRLSELSAMDAPIVPKVRKAKFKEVFQRFLNHKHREVGLQVTTIQKYQQTGKHLEFFNDFDCTQIDVRVIDAWVNFLRDPEYIDSQLNRRINYSHEYDLLRNVLNYYVEFENEGYRCPLLNRHRKRLCSRPKGLCSEVKFLSQDQVEQLNWRLAAFNKGDKECVLAKLMRVQLETGMRIGEVAALEFHQVIFARQEIHVKQRLQWDRSKHGKITLAQGTKGGPSRIVYMSSACMEILSELRLSQVSTKIFSRNDEWIPFRHIQHFYGKQLKAVGSPSTGTHSLRHTFAVNFLKKTKDIHALQKLLGHSNLDTTQIYAKYSDESTRKSFEIFNGNVLAVEFRDLAHKGGSQR